MEIKNHLGSIIQVNRNSISLQRIRIESIPQKAANSECLHAIYEEDGTLIHTFDIEEKNSDSKPISKFWLIPLIFGIAMPTYRPMLVPFLIDYFIWNSYNMTYLFKNYPLCRVRKLPKTQNEDFFKK